MWIVTLFLELLFWPLTLTRLSWSLTRWLFLRTVVVHSPTEALSSASLSTLTDISLLAILEHLPIADLLTAQCLSKRLAILASSAARGRRSIILIDSIWSIRHLTRVFPPTIGHNFSIPENSPRRVYLHPAHPAILRLSAPQHQANPGAAQPDHRSLSWQPLTTHLPVLFPKVIRLYVSVQGDATILQMLVFLVGSWPKLTRLHFRFQMVDPVIEPTAQEKATVRALYEALLAAINGLPDTFHHLHLDIRTSFATTPRLTIDLPIVAQLKSLYLRTDSLGNYSEGDQRHGLLFRYLRPRDSMTSGVPPCRRLAIDTRFTVESFLQVPAYLASCLVKVDFQEAITEGSLPNFALICRRLGSEGGGSLQNLSVSCKVPLYRLVDALAPLCKLTHLCLSMYPREEPKEVPSGRALQQLISVRSLKLSHFSQHHTHLQQLTLALANHFPHIRVAWLSNIGVHCVDCGHRWPGGEGEHFPKVLGFDPQLDAQCAQVGQTYLRQYLPNLQTLLSLRRTGWMECDLNFNVQHAPWN